MKFAILALALGLTQAQMPRPSMSDAKFAAMMKKVKSEIAICVRKNCWDVYAAELPGCTQKCALKVAARYLPKEGMPHQEKKNNFPMPGMPHEDEEEDVEELALYNP